LRIKLRRFRTGLRQLEQLGLVFRRRADPVGVAGPPLNKVSKSQPCGRLSGSSSSVRRAPRGRAGVRSTATRLVSRLTSA
jgi:hypothetical protein